MRNVLVLTTGGARHAVELRWVREVISLGDVTRVPRAPRHILGVSNVRGAITPLLDLEAFRDDPPADAGRPPRRGQGAVLIEVEGLTAALRMDAVDEVSTVDDADVPGQVIDSQGRTVPLCNPPELLAAVRDAARTLHAAASDPGPTDARDGAGGQLGGGGDDGDSGADGGDPGQAADAGGGVPHVIP